MDAHARVTLGEIWESEFIFELSQALGVHPCHFVHIYTSKLEYFLETAQFVLDCIVSLDCKDYILQKKCRAVVP